MSGEVVRRDIGGWISGPAISTETVAAEQVRQGDVLVLDDGTKAEVTDIRHGTFHLDSGRGQGVALGWRSPSGRSSGVLFRRSGDLLDRVTGGER